MSNNTASDDPFLQQFRLQQQQLLASSALLPTSTLQQQDQSMHQITTTTTMEPTVAVDAQWNHVQAIATKMYSTPISIPIFASWPVLVYHSEKNQVMWQCINSINNV